MIYLCKGVCRADEIRKKAFIKSLFAKLNAAVSANERLCETEIIIQSFHFAEVTEMLYLKLKVSRSLIKP